VPDDGHQKRQQKGKKMTEEYNGWSNRETWATALHINNDQSLYEIAQDYTKQEIEGHDKGETINAYYLGQTFRNWIEDDLLTIENISGNRALWLMLSDIGSLHRVNWEEIAYTFLMEMAIG
jgi:hypothetical protein